jgi:hypothetical protein
MTHRLELMCVVAAALATGCGGEVAGPTVDGRAELLQTLVDDVLIPRHEDFRTQAAAMARAMEAHCEAPTTESFEEARRAWDAARGAWKRREVFAYGPFREFPERLGPVVDTWPVREESVIEILEGGGGVDADAVGSYGSTTRGFPVLEYLMFGPDEDFAQVSPERRCGYMVGAAVDLERSAQAFYVAWTTPGGYGDALRSPGSTEDGMYESVQEAMSEVVNRMWYTIENMRRDKLGKPVGDETGGAAQPTSVESYYGRRSKQDLLDALATVDELFEIEGGIASHPRVAARDELVGRFRDTMRDARAAIEAIDGPLSEAVVEDNASARAALDALAPLQNTIQVDLVGILSLDISFNDADGD